MHHSNCRCFAEAIAFRLHKLRAEMWIGAALLAFVQPTLKAAAEWRMVETEVWRESGEGATITSVAALEHTDSAKFRRFEGYFDAGFTRAVHWFRLKAEPGTAEGYLVVMPPYLGNLQVFEPTPGNDLPWKVQESGARFPFVQRDVPYRGFVFRMRPAHPGETSRVLYVRVQTDSITQFSAFFVSDKKLGELTQREHALIATEILTLAVLGSFNLIGWLLIRDRQQLAFAAILLTQAIVRFGNSGYMGQYFLPEYPKLAQDLLRAANLGSYAVYALFCLSFLAITRAQGKARSFYLGMIGASGLSLCANFLGYYPEAATAMAVINLVSIFVGIGQCMRVWRERGPGWIGVILTMGVLLSGMFLVALNFTGIIHSSAPEANGMVWLRVGTTCAAQITLLSRFRRLREAYLSSEKRAEQERQFRQRQEEFIDFVSHEYRTPLATLQTQIAIAERTSDLNQQRAVVARMHAPLQRLLSIFKSPLAKGEWGNLRSIELRKTDLRAFVQHHIEHSMEQTENGSHRLRLPEGGPVFAWVDPILLAAIFSNLIENAVKYSVPAEAVIDISVSAQSPWAILRIENPCACSLEADGEKLLQKGYRGVNAGNTSGTGLGLYMVQKLTVDMGGAVKVCPLPVSRFRIELMFPTAKPQKPA
jgi:signal transduction histidine kinase